MSKTDAIFSLPACNLKITAVGNSEVVWDIVRMKNIVLTPEELVRQRMIHFLAHTKSYPVSHMVVEKSFLMNGRKKRADLLIHDSSGQAKVLIELKAPSVAINGKTFSQLASYNHTLNVDYIVLSNGRHTFCFYVDRKENKMVRLDHIPNYDELL